MYLPKLDIKSAFRQIPVRAEDHSLLGIFWQGSYYYERVLPFGLRSSPAIFDSVASAIEWIIRNHLSNADLFHYLDDFLNVTTGHTVAQRQLAILLRAFINLGVPLARSLTFLGIILDCERLEARLPMDKLTDLRSLLASMINSWKISQRQLEFLFDKLSFAARVITPGRTFMHRLWSVCSLFQQPHYSITFTQECLDDLLWWMRLLSEWNGKFFSLHRNWTHHQISSYTQMQVALTAGVLTTTGSGFKVHGTAPRCCSLSGGVWVISYDVVPWRVAKERLEAMPVHTLVAPDSSRCCRFLAR